MENNHLFSIGEISKAVGVTRKIILNYEAKVLITPTKKTEPPETDTTRRLYYIEYSVKVPDEISYCVAIPAGSKGEYVEAIPEVRALSVYHHGAYEDIPDTRKKLFEYAKENGITLSGKCRHIYLEGPPQHKDKKKFITQIIAIIE